MLDLAATDLLDIALVAVVLYAVLRSMQRGRGGLALAGIVVFVFLFLVAQTVGLRLLSFLFQGFFAVLLFGLVVIFRDEIRMFFERLATWSFRRGAPAEGKALLPAATAVARATQELARQRRGALIALQGRIRLASHVHAGTRLEGLPSEALLYSIFDPHSVGHDGAVLIVEGRVTRFGCHLPLSTDAQKLGERGTRHAAALGLAERTDALCVVVSEERGTISLARDGRLETLTDASKLAERLDAHMRRRRRAADRPSVSGFFVRRLPLKAAAVVVAALLWYLFVHEAVVEYRSFTVPVLHVGLAPGLEVESIEPATVQVIASGPRRAFYFVDARSFGARIQLFDTGPGASEYFVTVSDLTLPADVAPVNVVPRNLRIVVRPRD